MEPGQNSWIKSWHLGLPWQSSQCLGLWLPMQGMQVQSLVGKLRSCMPFSQKKKKKQTQKRYHNKFKKNFKNDPHQKKKELTPKEALRIKLPSPRQFIAILGKAFGCPQGIGLFLLTYSFIEIWSTYHTIYLFIIQQLLVYSESWAIITVTNFRTPSSPQVETL